MRRILFILFASCLVSGAANVHVRSGATGLNNGTDWNNAYTTLPTTLTRGNVYYIADGTYPTYTFDDPASGDQTITINKATVESHGTSTGWLDSYGDEVATFTGSINFATPNYILDGIVGTAKSGHGFHVSMRAKGSGVWITADNITVRHTKVSWPDRKNLSYIFSIAVECRHWNGTGYSKHKNVTFQHLYITEIPGAPVRFINFDNALMENCTISGQYTTEAEHASFVIVRAQPCNDGTIRNCVFEDGTGLTGGITFYDAIHSRWKIYGNVFRNLRTGSGIITSNHHPLGSGYLYDSFIVNNTVDMLQNANHNAGFTIFDGGNNVARNNLFFRCYWLWITGETIRADNNYFSDCRFGGGWNPTGAGDTPWTSTPTKRSVLISNPFVNPDAGDYHLVADMAAYPGVALAAPFSLDADGTARGAGVWDRGAYEFGGVAPAMRITSPTTVTAVMGGDFSYQITATGSPTLYTATGLPLGLSINPANGIISGTLDAALSPATAQVSLSVTGATGSASAVLSLNILDRVNLPPTLNALGHLTLSEDAGSQTVTLSGISSGDVSETQALTITVASSNPSLIPTPTLTYESPNNAGSLVFTPTPNATGTAKVTVTVDDGQEVNGAITRSFDVTVTGANALPTITDIPPQVAFWNRAFNGISFTIGDAETSPNSLQISAVTSNSSLIPSAGIRFGGNGANRTLSLTPMTGRTGSATITITVRDPDGGSTTEAFVITFTSEGNNPPTLNPLGGVILTEGANPIPIGLTGISSGNQAEKQTLTITASSSNPGVVPAPAVNYVSPNATALMMLAPASNAFGSATITVKVSDGQSQNNTVTRTFNVTVTSLNDAPTLTEVLPQTTPMNQAITGIAFTVGDVETSVADLLVTASSSNPILLPDSNIAINGNNADRTLSLNPAAGQMGAATITLFVRDASGAVTSNSFTFTVIEPVNTPPILQDIADYLTITDRAVSNIPVSIADTVTPAEALVVTVNSSDTALIPDEHLVVTGTGAKRFLTVTPAAGQTGVATITVRVTDAETNATTGYFTFTVTGGNTAPSIASAGGLLGTVGVPLTLRATVTDDGLPGPFTTTWRQINGPAPLIFGNFNSRETTIIPTAPGTYFVRFTANDGALSAALTNVVQIGLSTVPAAPHISNVSFEFDKDKVAIRWNTDLRAQPQIEYGLTTDYGSATDLENKYVTSHKVDLHDLEPETTYHFRIRLRDTQGYSKASGDYVFTTPPEGVQDVMIAVPPALDAPPSVTAVGPAGNGHALVTGMGVPNVTSVLQTSLDLLTWVSIAAVATDNSGLIQYDDPVFGAFPNRFYRFAEW